MPVIVRELNDLKSVRLLGTENLLRQDWGPLELARYLTTLCKPVDDGGAGMKREAAAALFGRDYTWLYNHVKMLELPAVWQERVESGELKPHHVCKLIPYADKPAILRAIDADYQRNPWAWMSPDDFTRNVRAIAEKPGRTGRPRVAGSTFDKKLAAAKKKQWSDTPDEGSAPDVAKSAARTLKNRLAAGKQDATDEPIGKIKNNANRICRLLKPFFHNREMLVAIRDTCDRLIAELHDKPAPAEAVTV